MANVEISNRWMRICLLLFCCYDGALFPEYFGMEITMIDVTKMNDCSITVNADLIETVEETPDTVITLTTGKKIIVKESRQMIKNLVELYKRECNRFD